MKATLISMMALAAALAWRPRGRPEHRQRQRAPVRGAGPAPGPGPRAWLSWTRTATASATATRRPARAGARPARQARRVRPRRRHRQPGRRSARTARVTGPAPATGPATGPARRASAAAAGTEASSARPARVALATRGLAPVPHSEEPCANSLATAGLASRSYLPRPAARTSVAAPPEPGLRVRSRAPWSDPTTRRWRTGRPRPPGGALRAVVTRSTAPSYADEGSWAPCRHGPGRQRTGWARDRRQCARGWGLGCPAPQRQLLVYANYGGWGLRQRQTPARVGPDAARGTASTRATFDDCPALNQRQHDGFASLRANLPRARP